MMLEDSCTKGYCYMVQNDSFEPFSGSLDTTSKQFDSIVCCLFLREAEVPNWEVDISTFTSFSVEKCSSINALAFANVFILFLLLFIEPRYGCSSADQYTNHQLPNV